MVGLNQAGDLRYREWMVQRMKKALRFARCKKPCASWLELMAQMGMDKERVDQMRQLLQANQQAMEEQLRQFAGQRIAENMSQKPARRCPG